MPTYNKLVRDRIPEIIRATGRQCRTAILNEEDYRKELLTKLREESREYFAAQSPEESLEELADLLEVIRALAAVHGATWEQLETLCEKKTEARGGFQDRLFLIDVDD
ncbi:nucleoside triphosphate pyrophosphohydrolase [Paenibacillus sp. YN15]|uniref:nucleoside triphosphate pyrophosphohydrolase n=1 Tax=Paenibacillus sp. YN15 TaxID=1742774 RepID=UPI000DCCCEC6|nr:nucleoside triphosphate pyrophosphohydrolase [Paenibacillus sp. YN15]RAV02670.1 hypothetical protein DQG13_09185 [Paenibacillus sp. YN15]